MYPDQLVVCVDSIALVHETASAWSALLDKDKSPFGLSMSHCLNVIRSLSQCMHILNEEKCLDKRCDECYYRRDIHRTCNLTQENGHDPNDETDATDGQTKPRKKRKLLGKSTDLSVFKELERYAVQLHMKEQCDWCIDAALRVEIMKKAKNGQK